MNQFKVAYIPIGVPTFHLETAQQMFTQSKNLLRAVCGQLQSPETILLSISDLQRFCDQITPDAIVLQNTTFANAAYAAEILKRFKCPILLWTLREPVIDGGRLCLNSLTGAYSAANTLHEFGCKNFLYVFGSPNETAVHSQISAFVRAAQVKHDLSSLKIAAIGHTPQGFGFGRALDSELLHNFGVTLESIEVRELIDNAKSFSNEECIEFLSITQECTVGLERTPERNIQDHTKLLKAYVKYINENQIGAVASRCWPDFFTSYGTPVCTVLSLLNDMGISASCEADVYGALSMYIGQKLSGVPTFFGDPVSLDEQNNTITYWHCGMAACSLANKATGATIGVHPNRKIGPAMDFACKECGKVTIFRIGRIPGGNFRMFLAKGKALDVPKQFIGTSVVIQTQHPCSSIVENSVQSGWEPHFVVVYADVTKELQALARLLNLEIEQY